MKKAGLRIKAQKCYLLKQKVALIGHLVDGEGVHMDPEKVRAFQDSTVPRNIKQFRRFPGLTSFYYKFS